MRPIAPEDIALSKDGVVSVSSPYWQKEIAASEIMSTSTSTNGSCENVSSCVNSTNSNVCNNYTACNGSTNGTCITNVTDDRKEP